MFLSRVALDLQRRDTVRALASPHVLHGAVEASFSGDDKEKRERSLWRIDHLGDLCYLLVLSKDAPHSAAIATQFGYADKDHVWETKCYQALLSGLKQGQVFRFRLRANPVRSSSAEKDPHTGRGKVFAHVPLEQQKAWLLSRAEAHGFTLADHTFDVVHTEWKKFRKAKGAGKEVSLRIADFEGKLAVANPELLKNTLTLGLGRAKSYGCGLLTIARERTLHDG